MLVRVWRLGLILLLLGCGEDPGSSTYKIRILAETTATLDQHITAQGAAFDSGPFISRGKWYVNYSASESLDQLIDENGSVVLSTEEHPDQSVRMQPYLCGEKNNYSEARRDGASATETHEVLLTEAGEWKLNTDFTRRLRYDCQLVKDGHTDGVGTYFAQPNRCDAIAAEGTSLEVRAIGLPGLTPKSCLSHLNDLYDGIFGIILSFQDTNGHDVGFSFNDCFPSAGPPTYPVTYTWGENYPDPACYREGANVALYREVDGTFEPISVFPSELRWTIQSADLIDGGTQTSDIEARYVLSEDPQESYTLLAHVTGPLYRIPIEGDGI